MRYDHQGKLRGLPTKCLTTSQRGGQSQSEQTKYLDVSENGSGDRGEERLKGKINSGRDRCQDSPSMY